LAALADFEALLERVPKAASSRANRARTLVARGGWTQRIGGDPTDDYELAIEELGRAIQDLPGDKGFLNSRGIAWRQLGDWLESQREDPTNAYTHAIQDYSELINVNPNHYFARLNRGNAYWLIASWSSAHGLNPQKTLSLALEDLSTSIEINPSDWRPRETAGRVLEKLGRPEEALQEYEAGVRLNPRRSSLLRLREECRRNLGKDKLDGYN
jgi:serine/threonine-protein kinase